MVNEVINNQESVMGHLEYPYWDVGILCIMLCYIQFELVSCFLRVYGSINARFPFVQHCQNCIIHVVVNENDASRIRTYRNLR